MLTGTSSCIISVQTHKLLFSSTSGVLTMYKMFMRLLDRIEERPTCQPRKSGSTLRDPQPHTHSPLNTDAHKTTPTPTYWHARTHKHTHMSITHTHTETTSTRRPWFDRLNFHLFLRNNTELSLLEHHTGPLGI